MNQTRYVTVVARGLWPRQARAVAKKHNNEHHDGMPTACIEVDPTHIGGWLPRYWVVCYQCGTIGAGKWKSNYPARQT